MRRRVAITFDGTAWFLRRIASVTEDNIRGEMVYHCNKHLGGPYRSLPAACAALSRQNALRAARNIRRHS